MARPGFRSPSSLVPRAAALLLVLSVPRALALPEICIQCPGDVQNLSEVALYCKQTPELMLQGRCCLNGKGTILGLDLQNCSLKDPGPDFAQAHTAVIIDLQANPFEGDWANTFRGFTQLQTLILPQGVNCPGGINAWDVVTFYITNQTCQGQRTFATALGTQKRVLRMDLVLLMVLVSCSVFVLMASMATSVCARAHSHCSCSSVFWDPQHYPFPSCFGGLNAEKPRLHEPQRSSY
uniref:All-trans retinoic acid induced differentiation factor n=1 Tax=Sus scrofa TaxID=9823 RepID=I3LEQ2_PIG